MTSWPVLPEGSAPEPVALPHFPDRLHAFVWRNWTLVPLKRIAEVAGTEPPAILELGRAMGLSDPPAISNDQLRRSAITLIRRNWHLLPYEQLLQMLGWTTEQMAFTLREDDFLYHKLGQLKPRCAPIAYRAPDADTRERQAEMARITRQVFPQGADDAAERPFAFVADLSQARRPQADRGSTTTSAPRPSRFSPRFCYSYFALYGDPLLDPEADPFPDGYLARLADAGVDGVWLPGILHKLAPFPWAPDVADRHDERLDALAGLVRRSARHGMGVHLYLNEPRAMPLSFFEQHPGLRGVVEGDFATLCTSEPSVRTWLRDAVAHVCRVVPDLAGLLTITASENLSHCWSHYRGHECPRCGVREAAEVVADANRVVAEGIAAGGGGARLFAWDWGWKDEWAEAAIRGLPGGCALVSVSEWSMPIARGGVESVVGEYSLSAVGPGPRARRHWGIARANGLGVVAKIQAANTWELSAVPYIPAVANTAEHVRRLGQEGVDGLMLGWTLGGYPSANLEAMAEVGRAAGVTVEEALLAVARRRFGAATAPQVVAAWQRFSSAFAEFPYHIGTVYHAPLQVGPANLLWEAPTGYRATMVGIPYDDLDGWRAVYPAVVFAAQLDRVADGFNEGVAVLRAALAGAENGRWGDALRREIDVADAAAIHFRSVAFQTRFVGARNALAETRTREDARLLTEELEQLLRSEVALAVRLRAIQARDSRIGFEATNQYYYVPVDLGEKVLNCRDLLDRWLPSERARRDV